MATAYRNKAMTLLVLLAALTGCAAMPGMPGHVSVTHVDFDGTTEVRMKPGNTRAERGLVTNINLGFFWTTRSPETVLIIAKDPWGESFIPANDGLQFMIDGELTKLDSQTYYTEYDAEFIQGVLYQESSRPFRAPLSFVRKLAEHEGAKVKMLTGQSQYYVATLDASPGSAYNGLQRFLDAVDSALAQQ